MNWKKKNGEWRACDGENRYVVTKGTDTEKPFVAKIMQPRTNINWDYFLMESITKGKQFCETMNDSMRGIIEADKRVREATLARLNEVNVLTSKYPKSVLRAYSKFRTMNEIDREILKVKFPDKYEILVKMEQSGFNPDQMFYEKEQL
jgi:hypothetical protein